MINVDKSPFRYLAIAMTTFCLCYILGSLLYSFAVFVVVNFFFAVVDLTGKPEFLLKYKITHVAFLFQPASAIARCHSEHICDQVA